MSGFKGPVERAEAELARIEGVMKQGEQQVAPEVTTPVTPEVKPEPEVVAGEPERKVEEKADYKQRWLSLQGQWRKSQDTIKTLTDKINQLDQRLSEGPATALSENATQQDIVDHLATLSSEYGEDFSKALSGVVNNLVDEKMKTVSGDLKKVNQKVDDAAEMSVSDRQVRFEADLTKRVKDWNAIFFSDEFTGWLSTQIESFSGKSYTELFDEANNSWDLERMVRFFDAYKQENGLVKEERKSDEREEHVVPGSSKGGDAPPAQQEARQWDGSSVNKFYDDVRRGLYDGKDAEVAAIEQEIFAQNRPL